jgi:acyl carrier protein
MTVSSLPSTQRAVAIKEGFIPTEIRAFIAEYVGMGVEQITDATHFVDDLDIDRLDRLELMILIEDLTGVELLDDEMEEIELVGDLIDRVASLDYERTAAMLVSRKVMRRRM